MAHEIQATIQYFDEVWREKMLEDIKRRSSPTSALRELQRKRREKMMAIIDSGMADISKMLEENLLQVQNHYIEPKINVEEKESLVVKETHEEECEKKREDTKESGEKEVEEKDEEKENEKEKEEKNVGKFWSTITLVPSSKLVCVVKCWNSSDILKSPNLSSLSHEGNQANEEEVPHQVKKNYEQWKHEFVQESQEEKFLHNSLPLYAGLDLRANPFEEGKNDEIKSSLSTWKETYKKNSLKNRVHGIVFW
jgi:hypothetical protein